MADFALVWDQAGFADLAIEDDDVLGDEGLQTAELLSMFLDARAEDDDALPGDDGDRRGWWGDEFAEVEGDRVGSRRWLLGRAKSTPDFPSLLEQYDQECHAWLLEDRVASAVDVDVTTEKHAVGEVVTVHRPDQDPTTFDYSHVWAGEEARTA